MLASPSLVGHISDIEIIIVAHGLCSTILHVVLRSHGKGPYKKSIRMYMARRKFYDSHEIKRMLAKFLWSGEFS